MFRARGSGNKAQRRAVTEAQSKKDNQATEFHRNHRIPKINKSVVFSSINGNLKNSEVRKGLLPFTFFMRR